MRLNFNDNIDEVVDYDITGQVIGRYSYFYGPLGFMGSLNVENGLWKLGARYYDSGKGSYIQQDRYMGDPGDPLSLNRYVYCGLDPVNYVDPTGLSKTLTVASTMWWLCAADGPIPAGDLAYAGIVLGTAIAEYGPWFSKIFELGSPSDGGGGGSGGRLVILILEIGAKEVLNRRLTH